MQQSTLTTVNQLEERIKFLSSIERKVKSMGTDQLKELMWNFSNDPLVVEICQAEKNLRDVA